MLAVLIKIIHFVVCVGLVVIVLLQADKGDGLAGAFGGGASSTVFGERGPGTLVSKATTVMAVVFMITSLLLSVYVPRWEKANPTSELSNAAPLSVPPGQMPTTTTGAPAAAPAPVTAAPATPVTTQPSNTK